METGSYLSIITLNINGLNAPMKRQRLTEWIQNNGLYICCLKETHVKARVKYNMKLRGWKQIFYANEDQKKAGIAIFMADKMDFEIKTVIRDKEEYYIMIIGSIQKKKIKQL